MIKLPVGYRVVKDRAIDMRGISYEDSKGNIVFQHPVDSDEARRALYCLCTEPTGHSSGLMADGACPIICQACGKEMFIKGIHSRVEISYIISLLEREKQFIEHTITEVREAMEWSVKRIEECKKSIGNKEKKIEEIDKAIGVLKSSNQIKEDNVQNEK